LNNLMPQQITDQAKQIKKVLDCMSSDQFSPFMVKS
jgi:hypothetical protein